MKVGDKVNWQRESRGGYGFITNVAAVVEKMGAKRIQVRVAQKIKGEWHGVLRWVEPSNLSERISIVPEVDIIEKTSV